MEGSKPYNEPEVLKRLALGKEEAFGLIYERYSPIIYKEALRYLRSQELARDIVQEIFTTVWTKRESFVTVAHFHAYLITMGKNLAYQSMVRLSKEHVARREFSILLAAEESRAPESHEFDMQKLAETLVNQLPQQQKHVFTLAKLRGMSYSAIAQTLNISPNTVKNHIIAANNFIRKSLQHSSIWGYFILAFMA